MHGGRNTRELVRFRTHHPPSRRTRVSLKNYWLPSSSSTCPSETSMLRSHSSPLEEKTTAEPSTPSPHNHSPHLTSQHKLSLLFSPLFILAAVDADQSLPKTLQEGCRNKRGRAWTLGCERVSAWSQLQEKRVDCAQVCSSPSFEPQPATLCGGCESQRRQAAARHRKWDSDYKIKARWVIISS